MLKKISFLFHSRRLSSVAIKTQLVLTKVFGGLREKTRDCVSILGKKQRLKRKPQERNVKQPTRSCADSDQQSGASALPL